MLELGGGDLRLFLLEIIVYPLLYYRSGTPRTVRLLCGVLPYMCAKGGVNNVIFDDFCFFFAFAPQPDRYIKNV